MKILISRRKGGFGDQICVESSLRAARTRFPDSHITFVTDDMYYSYHYDQTREYHDDLGPDICIAPDLWQDTVDRLEEESDLHFKLDGPEMRHQLDTDYNLTQSRIESWVNYVDCVPDDMCPRWYSNLSERQRVISWLGQAGIKPFNYIMIQWCTAEPKKDYPHMEELVLQLRKLEIPVVVCHNGIIPQLDVFEIKGWSQRDVGCLTQLATLTIGADSFLQHLSGAVKTPSLGLFGPANPKLYLKYYPLSRYLWYTDTKGKSCEKTTPCYGVAARNWWCGSRLGYIPWCLEQISPEVVVETAYDYIEELKERRFYKEKAQFLSEGTSSLFYFPDPRVNLSSLNAIYGTSSLDIKMRSRVVRREVCKN